MALTAGITDKFMKVGNPGTATTLSAPGYTIADASITVGSTTNWSTDTLIVFAIDRAQVVNGVEERIAGTYCEFVGIVTGATTISSLTKRFGTAQNYAAGSLTRVYIPVSATRENDLIDGIRQDHNNKGNHNSLTDDNGNEWLERGSVAAAINQLKITNAAIGTNPILSASGDDTNIGITITPKGTGSAGFTKKLDAWVTGLPTPNTVTHNGNRSYDLVFNTTDLTGYLSAGMRLKLTRTVTAPTQCTSLNGSTQYYSKASPNKMAWTDDFTFSAWIKLSSYALGDIISKRDGTQGWECRINGSGQLEMVGYNAALANYSLVQSNQSIPLNRWVHVAGLLDMSAFTAAAATAETLKSWIMIDGVEVSANVSRAGTNPTALVQAGNLNIGAVNAAQFLPGKIAQVAVYNTRVTQAIIKASAHQALAGTETSLASAYSFNGVITDLNVTTPNDLTANGSALATNADSPFGLQADLTTAGTTEYAIIEKTAFSTNTTLTVQVPEGNAIPTSGGVSAMAYSAQKVPYGFVADAGRWEVSMLVLSIVTASGSTVDTTYNPGGLNISIPVGSFNMLGAIQKSSLPTGTVKSSYCGLSTSASAFSDSDLADVSYQAGLVAGQTTINKFIFSKSISVTAVTPYYILVRSAVALTAAEAVRGTVSTTIPENTKISLIPTYL